jgi:octaprenyl-diphosphate synthase
MCSKLFESCERGIVNMVAKQVENGLAAVEQKLRDVVQTDVDLLRDASMHIISSGGKRLRPRLVFLSFLAAGGQDIAQAVPLAAAVELVHTATLVHDDINDHSLTRRGRITVHARWGRTFALLTGDYLFTKVYEMMAPYGDHYNVIMADACVKLVEGETLQAAAAKAGTIDQETYRQIIGRKTASLFEAAARMGANLGGMHDELAVKALGEYAYNLGLAFQITDDVLDIVGDPETLGKPVGNDFVQGAGFVAAQNGRRHGGGAAIAEAEEQDPIRAMMTELRESGAVELARAQARERARRAKDALHRLPHTPARDELFMLIDQVVERQH